MGGVSINNHTTTLPARKGLSSSAAICVMVARAFNRKSMHLLLLLLFVSMGRWGRSGQCEAYHTEAGQLLCSQPSSLCSPCTLAACLQDCMISR